MVNMVSPEIPAPPQKRKAIDDQSAAEGGAKKKLKVPSKYD